VDPKDDRRGPLQRWSGILAGAPRMRIPLLPVARHEYRIQDSFDLGWNWRLFSEGGAVALAEPMILNAGGGFTRTGVPHQI